jgi:hypothetical protein
MGMWLSDPLWQQTDSVSVTIKNASSAQMSLRLWHSYRAPAMPARTFSAVDQVKDPTIADAVMNLTNNYLHEDAGSFATIDAASTFEFSRATFDQHFGMYSVSPSEWETQLMFEGISAGTGDLDFQFKRGGQVLAERSIRLDLQPVTNLYEHYTVATGPGVGLTNKDWSSSNTSIDPRSTPVPTVPTFQDGSGAASFAKTKDYVLFVHGWNMAADYRVSYASTAYKRLYWQNYKGTFGMFSWPTQVASMPLTDQGNYNRSEQIAWNSAAGLKWLIDQKQSLREQGGKLTVLAHSMGNIVASEALALEGNRNVVDTTVLSQAAVSSDMYVGVGNSTPYYAAFGGEVGGSNPRFRHLDQTTSKLLNFNNANDYALTAWGVNNIHKPGGPYHADPAVTQMGFLNATYDVLSGPPPVVQRKLPNGTVVPLTMTTDRYEMFAHGLYSEAGPIGKINALPGPFTGAFDLTTIGFGISRTDHSGEFNHSNIEMNAYWAKFIQVGGL